MEPLGRRGTVARLRHRLATFWDRIFVPLCLVGIAVMGVVLYVLTGNL